MKKLTVVFLCVFVLAAVSGCRTEAAIAQDAQVPRSAGGAGPESRE